MGGDSEAPDRSTKRATHWERVHRARDPGSVSWYQPRPETSLRLIGRAGLAAGSRVLDVGAGASTLVDHLLDLGYRPTVLDVSEAALERVRRRLGDRAGEVEWVRADVTRWRPPGPRWDLWHDRATFHFLIDESDRRAYRETLLAALRPGGHAVIATFGPDGPDRCSGLPVRRHSADDLGAFLAPDFRLEEWTAEDHHTPSGTLQRFLFARLRRA